jgi:hypothetical protein
VGSPSESAATGLDVDSDDGLVRRMRNRPERRNALAQGLLSGMGR